MSATRSKIQVRNECDELFRRASAQEDKGRFRSAFRLYLAAAKAGDTGCQVNVGNFYDNGTGVRRNKSAALYWYMRAYRRGVACAASNIGTVWRNEGKLKRALSWFQRAVEMGDDEANLEIAKHYLFIENNPREAIPYLKKVSPSKWVTEDGAEEAANLLKQAKRILKRQ
jgi:TPR repeat protein